MFKIESSAATVFPPCPLIRAFPLPRPAPMAWSGEIASVASVRHFPADYGLLRLLTELPIDYGPSHSSLGSADMRFQENHNTPVEPVVAGGRQRRQP